MPFIPTGYLKHSEAINRVAEIINSRDPVPPLTQEERDILHGVRARIERAKRGPPPKLVTPIHSLSSNKPFVSNRVRKLVEAEPTPSAPPPKISLEALKALMAKEARIEARIKEEHHVAGEVLRQLLYAGRVPHKTLNENGLCIETPKHIWGGKQWDEALRSNWVEFPSAYGSSVSGRPIILLDALEGAFNPDGTVKEESRPVVSKATAAASQPDAGTPETRREKQARETKEKYERWYTTSQEIKADNKPRKPIELAKAVEKQERKGDHPKANAETIKRRLNEDHPGWAG